MKRFLLLVVVAVLGLSLFAGCAKTSAEAAPSASAAVEATEAAAEVAATEAAAKETAAAESTEPELTTIKVGASTTPHAEILAVAKEILAEQGYDLEIVEFTDYVLPNEALSNSELDANYFQHQPYLNQYNSEKGTDLVSIASIHFEPLGIYPGKTATLEDLKDGAQVAVPNDATNEARALLLLEAQGLITLDKAAGVYATVNDITENPKNLDIVEIEAAQLARSLVDVDIAVINGNYAIEAGLNVSTDALAQEAADSLAATTYANILVVRSGDEGREDLKALAAVLTSDDIKSFIEENYKGAVVPVF